MNTTSNLEDFPTLQDLNDRNVYIKGMNKIADMEIVGSTGSTLPEPSLENTLRSHARFIFAFEEPEKL